MRSEACDATGTELLAIAGAAGSRINARWITKYVRRGLLPALPNRPGLGRGKGRPARYTAVTRRQLPALLDALSVYGKNLRAVGWHLWKHGFDVDRKYWHGHLSEQAKTLETLKRRLNASDSLLESALQWIDKSRPANSMIGRARRRLGAHLSVFTGKLTTVATGEYHAISDLSYDKREFDFESDLFAKALAMPRQVPVGGNQTAQWPVDIVGIDLWLARLSTFFAQDLVKWFATLSDAEILSARDEFQPLLELLTEFAKATEERIRLPGLEIILALSKSNKFDGILLFGWMCICSEPGFKDRALTVATALREALAKIKLGGGDGIAK